MEEKKELTAETVGELIDILKQFDSNALIRNEWKDISYVVIEEANLSKDDLSDKVVPGIKIEVNEIENNDEDYDFDDYDEIIEDNDLETQEIEEENLIDDDYDFDDYDNGFDEELGIRHEDTF